MLTPYGHKSTVFPSWPLIESETPLGFNEELTSSLVDTVDLLRVQRKSLGTHLGTKYTYSPGQGLGLFFIDFMIYADRAAIDTFPCPGILEIQGTQLNPSAGGAGVGGVGSMLLHVKQIPYVGNPVVIGAGGGLVRAFQGSVRVPTRFVRANYRNGAQGHSTFAIGVYLRAA